MLRNKGVQISPPPQWLTIWAIIEGRSDLLNIRMGSYLSSEAPADDAVPDVTVPADAAVTGGGSADGAPPTSDPIDPLKDPFVALDDEAAMLPPARAGTTIEVDVAGDASATEGTTAVPAGGLLAGTVRIGGHPLPPIMQRKPVDTYALMVEGPPPLVTKLVYQAYTFACSVLPEKINPQVGIELQTEILSKVQEFALRLLIQNADCSAARNRKVAYRTLFAQWAILFRIGAANRDAGHPVTSHRRIIAMTWGHLRSAGPDPVSD